METNLNGQVEELIKEYSAEVNYNYKELAIILAAGHGKRIKSQTSKMLHKIWEAPTVERVYNACIDGINNINVLLVVGIKAPDVIQVIGKRSHCIFAYQETQNGTGHAVQVGLEKVLPNRFDGIVYVLPGDMGLIDSETLKSFREKFLTSDFDMMVLTGLYDGDPKENSYGRIVRVKEKDVKGKSSGTDLGKVIEIIEYKDILRLPDDKLYILNFNGKDYGFTKQELLENNEFNSGVYAFKYKPLIEQIGNLTSNNAQKEIYITELISLFNKAGKSVGAVSPADQYVLMGFNNKSVLREMEAIARQKAYDKLKDIIEINDPQDFFIDDDVIKEIIELDQNGVPLDIKIGKGVYIGKGVKINYNLELKKNAYIDGNVRFGKNVSIWENVHLSCFAGQELSLGDNVEILWGDIVKGNISIGDNSRIESSVNMTGSDEYPLRIGKDVLIKGTSYIFGSIIEDGIQIEHSLLIRKHIERLVKKNGKVQPIRYYLPMPEGIDAIDDLK